MPRRGRSRPPHKPLRESRRHRSGPPEPPANAAAATGAGLAYVCDNRPGIRREMGPLGFRYRAASGRLIRDAAELKRIRALAVPPAWTDVWICSSPRGHVQATGRDARGRKQYRYHAHWRACRDETKFDRLQQFAAALPAIRARVEADIVRPGLPREKVLAVIVRLLEKSLIRVGNEEYARQNGSFGLTTMLDRHVDVRGRTLRFQFRGKSGVRHTVRVDDRRLARIVKQCRDLPGQELFQYRDDGGRRQDVTSSDVNSYLKEIGGDDFTAKDFRTWSGTVLAVAALRELAPAATKARAEKNVIAAIEAVAGLLGNTRAVCRRSYIHPRVIECYKDGTMRKALDRQAKLARSMRASLRPDELAVLAVLQAGSAAAVARPARRRAA